MESRVVCRAESHLDASRMDREADAQELEDRLLPTPRSKEWLPSAAEHLGLGEFPRRERFLDQLRFGQSDGNPLDIDADASIASDRRRKEAVRPAEAEIGPIGGRPRHPRPPTVRIAEEL
jgi:hypothetical protein